MTNSFLITKKVFDGFVVLDDMMGDDLKIIKTAGTSYGRELENPATRVHVIKNLITSSHTTPLEHVVFTFYMKVPEVVFRQMVRYRMSTFNVQSRRYKPVETLKDFYIPESLTSEQKSALMDHYKAGLDLYNQLIADGVHREQARVALAGLAVYVKFYWTINAHSLMHFLEQRLSKKAQYEIRVYAEALEDIFAEVLPLTHQAWRETLVNK